MWHLMCVWHICTSQFILLIVSSLTNSNFKENPQVSCVSKKDEKEEVEKKLPKEYEPLFILKCL